MALTLTDIRVAPGGKTRLLVDDLSIATGQLTFVVGPNGAGKTTLLKAIAGLVQRSGTIAWTGSELDTLTPRQRARLIAYVPQNQITHWPIMARTAVAIGRNPHASSLNRLSDADNAAIDDALTATAAMEYAQRPLDQLSGGERARVLLARALAVEAPLLLLDEPVAALDPAHQIAFVERLSALRATRHLTILCVVHDLALASRYGDQIVVVDHGRVAANGSATDVLTDERLKTTFGIVARRIADDDRSVVLPWAVTSTA